MYTLISKHSIRTIIWAPPCRKHGINKKKFVILCVQTESSFKALKANTPFSALTPSHHSLPLWFLLPWHNLGGGLRGCRVQRSTTLTPSKHLKLSHLRGELPSNRERNQRPFHSVTLYKYVTLSVVGGSFLLFYTSRTENTAHQGMLEERICWNHL